MIERLKGEIVGDIRINFPSRSLPHKAYALARINKVTGDVKVCKSCPLYKERTFSSPGCGWSGNMNGLTAIECEGFKFTHRAVVMGALDRGYYVEVGQTVDSQEKQEKIWNDLLHFVRKKAKCL